MRLNDFTIPDNGFFTSVSLAFEEDSLSGETSSTATALKGIKPSEINTSFIVRKKEASTLTRFMQLARSTDDNGDLVLYNLTDETANAMNIRQVKFTGRVDVRESTDLLAWRVSFKLKEYLSVPEKSEQRQAQTTQESTDEGQQVAAAVPQDEEQVQYTGFEKVLKVIDDGLA